MDKQKQLTVIIEKVLRDTKNCDMSIETLTDYLVDRITDKVLPKNAVVLTREEYEMMVNQYKWLEIKYSNLCDNHRLCKDANETIKQYAIIARKETAEKFAERLKDTTLYWTDWGRDEDFAREVDEIAKEITEGKK